MSLPSLLLRILLSVALLVSGTGNAVAAMQMHLAQASAPHHGHAMDKTDCAPASHAGPATSGPCHDMDGTSSAPQPLHANDHCQPDCCAAGHCDGFCAQQAPATMPSAWVGNGPRACADLAGHIPAGHPAPPLPSPQRPPIA